MHEHSQFSRFPLWLAFSFWFAPGPKVFLAFAVVRLASWLAGCHLVYRQA